MKNEIKKNPKKYILLFGGIILLIIVVSLILFFLFSIFFKKYSFQEIEHIMVRETKNYLDRNPAILSDHQTSFQVTTETLITENYMKDFEKLRKNSQCSGYVEVIMNQNEQIYLPYLTCSDYETKHLRDEILANQPLVEEGDGLYDLYDYHTYRGDYVQNYIDFAGYNWRILKFNQDITYLILSDTVDTKNTYSYDDRYNEEVKSNRGKNVFETSRIHDELKKIYENDFTKYKPYLLQMDACVGSRAKTETDHSGAIECSYLYKTPISLLSLYDYLNASIDENCQESTSRNCYNYNYLATTKYSWWLLTGVSENTYQSYGSSSSGVIMAEASNSKKHIRPVIAISSHMIYQSGNGTKENPFKVKDLRP